MKSGIEVAPREQFGLERRFDGLSTLEQQSFNLFEAVSQVSNKIASATLVEDGDRSIHLGDLIRQTGLQPFGTSPDRADLLSHSADLVARRVSPIENSLDCVATTVDPSSHTGSVGAGNLVDGTWLSCV